jgi:hypothetical protein
VTNGGSGGIRAAFQAVKLDYKFAAADHDDSSWALLDVPHDSLVNGTFTDAGTPHGPSVLFLAVALLL